MFMADDPDLSAREAAARLGVKLPTLYAYVSRGLLQSRRGPGGRGRRYARADVERLLGRRGPGGRARAAAGGALSWGEPVLESRITALTPDGPRYRGHDAVSLAQEGVRFEAVAELLWSGTPPAEARIDTAAWRPGSLGVAPARLSALLPDDTPPLATLAVLVPALAVGDPGRFDALPAAVLTRTRRLIRRLAAGLALGRPARLRAALAAPSVAAATAAALGARGPAAAAAVERALVLCAAHELTASAFTARVAASTGADVYACVGAALGALSGPRHGAVTDQVEALLREAGDPDRAERAVHERLRRGEPVPGFGHPFYADGDPRCEPLLEVARDAAPRSREVRTLLALVDATTGAGRPPPNIDTGLVAVRAALGVAPGSAAGLFAVGRCAGWVAHVLEQGRAGGLLRPRARYPGDPAPSA